VVPALGSGRGSRFRASVARVLRRPLEALACPFPPPRNPVFGGSEVVCSEDVQGVLQVNLVGLPKVCLVSRFRVVVDHDVTKRASHQRCAGRGRRMIGACCAQHAPIIVFQLRGHVPADRALEPWRHAAKESRGVWVQGFVSRGSACRFS